MSLRILVNATALRLGGGGTYVVEQVAALAARPDTKVTAFATGEVAARLTEACGGRARVVALPQRSLPLRLLHEQLVLAWRARRHDVVYAAGGFAMFAAPRPQAVTNQNPHHFPASARGFWRERYPWRHRLRLELEWRGAHASVRRAEAFVTVSAAFAAAVEADLGRRPNVLMVPSAAPVLPAPADGGVAPPYVLTVAHDYPHKDWDGLIEAFLANPDLPRLVIAGDWRNAERRDELERRLGAAEGRIAVLGPVGDRARLAGLYRGAQAFVAHSFLEAGPLTPGEALSAGLSIAASDIPPHREACGPDAVLYDPRDTGALAGAVREAIARGPSAPVRRAWTWQDNAERLAGVLHGIHVAGPSAPTFTRPDGAAPPLIVVS